MFWSGRIKEPPEEPFLCPSMIDSVPDCLVFSINWGLVVWLV
jgi:hypothetical protein